jgi:hypothetical protein
LALVTQQVGLNAHEPVPHYIGTLLSVRPAQIVPVGTPFHSTDVAVTDDINVALADYANPSYSLSEATAHYDKVLPLVTAACSGDLVVRDPAQNLRGHHTTSRLRQS